MKRLLLFALIFSVAINASQAQAKKGKKGKKSTKKTNVSPPAGTQGTITSTPAETATSSEPAKPQRTFPDVAIQDGAFERTHYKKKPPVPQAYLREADALYSWNVLRVIDLSQKSNLVLTYPKSRLIDVLLKTVKSGELDGYMFSEPELTPENRIASEDVIKGLTKIDTVKKTDLETGIETFVPQKTEFNPEDVVKFRVKEEWVFDKNYGTMQVRIIAIAPVSYLKSEGTIIGEQAMFWVYYPAIRNDLASTEVFNWQNDGNKLSFDDFFMKRMFSSYIYKESNVKDLRIEDYKTGKDILKEADRIKNKILNTEMALWEY
jgi:gliding motility associated protien GldN